MSHLVGLEWVFRPINFAKISIYPLIHRLVGLPMRIFIRPGTDCCQNRLLPELETGRFLTHCCLSHKQDDGFLVGYGRYMWGYCICHTRYSGLNGPSLKSTQTSDANSLLKNFNSRGQKHKNCNLCYCWIIQQADFNEKTCFIQTNHAIWGGQVLLSK